LNGALYCLEYQPERLVTVGETTAVEESKRLRETFPELDSRERKTATKMTMAAKDYVEVNIESQFETEPKSGRFSC
jgi:hypothetical protein